MQTHVGDAEGGGGQDGDGGDVSRGRRAWESSRPSPKTGSVPAGIRGLSCLEGAEEQQNSKSEQRDVAVSGDC